MGRTNATGSARASRVAWQEEFKAAIDAVQDMPLRDQVEGITQAIGKTQSILLPRAYLRIAQILNSVRAWTLKDEHGAPRGRRASLASPQHLEIALSFLSRMQDAYFKNARWLVEKGGAKPGSVFPGFGGMQPLLDAGQNGNGHKRIVVQDALNLPNLKDADEVEIADASLRS